MDTFKYLRQKFQNEKTSTVTKTSAKTESKQTFSAVKTETKSGSATKCESKTVVSKVSEISKSISSTNQTRAKPEPEVKKKLPPPVAQKPKKKIFETEEKKQTGMPHERKSSLSEERIQELHETFNLFDKNRDGFISKEELTAMLYALGQRPTVMEVQALIRSVDIDKSGTIDFDEFVKIFSAKMCIDPEKELHEVFCIFDKNSDGFICADELYSMLQQLGEPITKTEAQKMINEADLNRDGKVDYREFKAILNAR